MFTKREKLSKITLLRSIGSFLPLFFYSFFAFAQNQIRTGAFPMLFYNVKIGKKGDFQAVFMPLLRAHDEAKPEGANAVIRFDAQFSLSVKLTPATSFATGFLSGVSEPNSAREMYENVLWQQFSTLHRFAGFRFYNRLRIEERFIEENFFFFAKFVPRLRYQSGFQIPLSGLEADVQEFYVNLNAEFLRNMDKEIKFKHEYRSYTGIGYIFSKTFSAEGGFEYRIRQRNEAGDFLNTIFFRIGLILRR
jgi:hypothetical protein